MSHVLFNIVLAPNFDVVSRFVRTYVGYNTCYCTHEYAVLAHLLSLYCACLFCVNLLKKIMNKSSACGKRSLKGVVTVRNRYVQAICGNPRAEMLDKRVILSSIVQHATAKEVMAFFGCSVWLVRCARIHAEVSVQ